MKSHLVHKFSREALVAFMSKLFFYILLEIFIDPVEHLMTLISINLRRI